jgi:hypothetical protein
MTTLVRCLLLVLVAANPCRACTTAVVSGSATPDGRPLLWKNRDISTTRNEVIRIDGGKYRLIAVVNCGSRSSIWMGVNDAGLCIENSLSRDLSFPEGVTGPGNGGFMLTALQSCATVGEFQKLLEATDVTGRATTANFGVIDAHGGAALFETSRKAHRMFDANDPAVAPQGFVVRSNFSFTGQKLEEPPTPEKLKDVYAGERYLRAETLLTAARNRGEAATGTSDAGGIDARFLTLCCARDLADGEGNPHPGSVNGPAGQLPEFIPTKSTISRTTTVSFAVFQGVKPGEDPLLTTMWVGLGDPKFSVAVPCWVAAGEVSSELVGKEVSPLCAAAIELRKKYYSQERDGITTEGLPEIWSEVWSFEAAAFERVEAKLEQWRSQGIDGDSMRAIHVSTAEQALATLKGQLERATAPAATSVPAAQ